MSRSNRVPLIGGSSFISSSHEFTFIIGVFESSHSHSPFSSLHCSVNTLPPLPLKHNLPLQPTLAPRQHAPLPQPSPINLRARCLPFHLIEHHNTLPRPPLLLSTPPCTTLPCISTTTLTPQTHM